MNSTLGAFTIRVVTALGLAALFFLLWQVIDVVVLAFGGIIFAVLLRAFSRFLARHTGMGSSWSLAVVLIGLALLLGVIIWLMQWRLSTELHQMTQTLPASWMQLRETIRQSPAGSTFVDAMQSMMAKAESSGLITRLAGTTLNAMSNLVLIPFVGIFLAADPPLYRRGLVSLVPARARSTFGGALDATGNALLQWLLGVLASMACIGVATGAGLWLLGVPLALTLGMLAGLLEFIPFLGPIASAVPAVLVAFTMGPARALEVVALYTAIQQIESYLLVPLLQKQAVKLPPAIAILAVVVFGLLFGLPGVVFATPLMVAVQVLVQKLYVARLDASAVRESSPATRN